MAVSVYDRRELTLQINNTKPVNYFLTDLLFKRSKGHTVNTFEIELYNRPRKASSHVSRGQEANVVKTAGTYVTKAITLPHSREKKLQTAAVLHSDKKLAGQMVDDLGAMKRAVIAEDMVELRDRFDITTEILAAQVLSGKIETAKFSLDMEMPAAHKPAAFASTAKWDSKTSGVSDANPITDINTYRKKIAKASGFQVDAIVMGSAAAAAFLDNTNVKNLLDNLNYRAGTADVTADINVAATPIFKLGNVIVYEYSQTYVDDAGNEQEIFPVDKVAIIATRAEFWRHYGVPEEIGEDMPTEFFAKQIISEDPSGLWLLVDSNMVPVCHRPTAIAYLDVV